MRCKEEPSSFHLWTVPDTCRHGPRLHVALIYVYVCLWSSFTVVSCVCQDGGGGALPQNQVSAAAERRRLQTLLLPDALRRPGERQLLSPFVQAQMQAGNCGCVCSISTVMGSSTGIWSQRTSCCPPTRTSVSSRYALTFIFFSMQLDMLTLVTHVWCRWQILTSPGSWRGPHWWGLCVELRHTWLLRSLPTPRPPATASLWTPGAWESCSLSGRLLPPDIWLTAWRQKLVSGPRLTCLSTCLSLSGYAPFHQSFSDRSLSEQIICGEFTMVSSKWRHVSKEGTSTLLWSRRDKIQLKRWTSGSWRSQWREQESEPQNELITIKYCSFTS